ncbi:DUF6010 family protein [Mucilaginibacter gilvus]|uniref:Uncharacterized protein n=1 Tax=Mucilaginibacter gilvus TaxID=2305909 RepID=A0A444MQJ0_9SPHI|nr:DUF6010 family protein [Mucilaginibacter gilvus]RWY53853.1 hypothetical protein EPL05_07225 [Mucilaginibacter gilvus]
MIALIIGVSSGLLIIGSIRLLRNIDEQLIYGLILSAIGFLYVGFTWTDLPTGCFCCLQAIVFLFIAYYGSKKSSLLLVGGYFLHGMWDMAYDLAFTPTLLPPHYDLFCMSIDFTMGFYLFVLYYRNKKSFSL